MERKELEKYVIRLWKKAIKMDRRGDRKTWKYCKRYSTGLKALNNMLENTAYHYETQNRIDSDFEEFVLIERITIIDIDFWEIKERRETLEYCR